MGSHFKMMGACRCSFFAIVIYNSNAAKDDNFRILLNSTSIGEIDNNSNTISGRIFCDPGHITDLTPANIDVPGNNFQTTLSLDMALLIPGVNTLQIEVTQDNGNGNFGVIQVGYWNTNNTNKYVLDSPGLLNTTYNFLSAGLGIMATRFFNYP